MYNPYMKIKVTDIFVPCYAGEHYSGIDNTDIQHMDKNSFSTISSFYVYDCSTVLDSFREKAFIPRLMGFLGMYWTKLKRPLNFNILLVWRQILRRVITGWEISGWGLLSIKGRTCMFVLFSWGCMRHLVIGDVEELKRLRDMMYG